MVNCHLQRPKITPSAAWLASLCHQDTRLWEDLMFSSCSSLLRGAIGADSGCLSLEVLQQIPAGRRPWSGPGHTARITWTSCPGNTWGSCRRSWRELNKSAGFLMFLFHKPWSGNGHGFIIGSYLDFTLLFINPKRTSQGQSVHWLFIKSCSAIAWANDS